MNDLPALGALTLGTAQFGSHYGIVNQSGAPSDDKLAAILRTASELGIRYMDTARVYGNAEVRIGAALSAIAPRSWRLISKVAPLDTASEANGIDPAKAAIASLDASLDALGIATLDVLMLHRARDASLPGVIDALAGAQVDGRVGALGVSVYSPEEAVAHLSDPRLTHVQVPVHLLDRRWEGGAFQQLLRDRPEIVVHARSVFLQGLLLNDAGHWPRWVETAPAICALLDELAAGLAGGRVELCLRFHRSLSWIDSTLIGVETAAQLREIGAAASPMPLDNRRMERLGAIADMIPARLLNPALWH